MAQFINMHYARPINSPIPSQPLAVSKFFWLLLFFLFFCEHGIDLFCAKFGEDQINSPGEILKCKEHPQNVLIVALMVPETHEPKQQWPYYSATVSDVQMLLGTKKNNNN